MSPWYFKDQRLFIEMAAAGMSFDEMVKRTRHTPVSVRKAALRLGVKLGKQTASYTRLLAAVRKAKGK